MGADEATLFRKVLWPGALPYMITDLHLSRIAGEPEPASARSSSMPRKFLDAGGMVGTLTDIAAIGVFFERFVFHT
jgi:hypothetical protein